MTPDKVREVLEHLKNQADRWAGNEDEVEAYTEALKIIEAYERAKQVLTELGIDLSKT